MLKTKRERKCDVCRTPFVKHRPMQKVCGPSCAEESSRLKREKEERKQDRQRKEAIKTRSDYIKEAQIAFNAYIRERDKGKTCICCDLPLGAGEVGGAFDCGHYRSVGSAPQVRFDPRNANGQRKQCNRYGSGRAVDYRIGLIQRIGLEAVEALEADNEPRKWTIEELKSIKAEYKEKLKELLRNKS